MAENVTPNPTPSERPDWIAATLGGQLDSTVSLMQSGLKAKDFNFDSPEKYWETPIVKEKFNNDEKAFRTFYDTEKARYEQTNQSDYELDINLDVAVDKWSRKPLIGFSKKSEREDIYGRSRLGDYYSAATRAPREAAIQNGIMIDDKMVSIDSYKGDIKLAKNEDGSFKLDKKGLPYWVPLKDGEELNTYDETYSSFAHNMGIYGLKPSYLAEGFYTVAKSIPNFINNTAESLLEVPRVTGIYDTSSLQTSLRSNLFPSSDAMADRSILNPMRLMELGLDVTYQLLSMGGVARAAGFLAQSGKAGSVAGRLYMTGMAAGPLAKVSREAGLSPEETAILYGINALGIYKISKLSDMVIKGIRPLEIQKMAEDIIPKAYGMTIAKKGFTQSGLKSFQNRVTNAFESAIVATSTNKMSQGFFLESLEEVSEQVLDSGLRGAHNLVAPLYNLRGRFQWDLGREMQALYEAGVAGGLGGMIAVPLLRKMGNYERELVDSYEAMTAFGDESIGYKQVMDWEKSGRLGKTPEENSRNASALREIINTMVTIRDQAGLKDAIRNNEFAAKEFANVLKSSSIGREQVVLQNELATLNNQLESAEKAKDETSILKLNEQIAAKKQQIESFNSGLQVDKYITEGLYNVESNPILKPNNKHSLKDIGIDADIGLINTDRFNGRYFAELNIESAQHLKTLISEKEAFNTGLLENDAKVNLDNFESFNITPETQARLRQELVTQREAALKIVLDNADAINELIPNEDIDVRLLANPKFDISSEISTYEDVMNDPAFQAMPGINDIIRIDKKLKSLDNYKKVFTPTQSAESDEVFFYDFENGKSTTPLISKLDELSRAAGLVGGETEANKRLSSTFISTEPERLVQTIDDRINQVIGTHVLKNKLGYKRVIGPEIKDVKNTLVTLGLLKGQFQELAKLSEANQSNTEARIAQIYIDTLDKQLNVIHEADKALGAKFKDLSDLIGEYDVELQEAIDKKDDVAFRKNLLRMERRIHEQFGANHEEILSALQGTFPDDAAYLSPEGQLKKATYDYMRGVLKVDSGLIHNAKINFITNTPDGSRVATREQQMIIGMAVQNALAGEYNFRESNSAVRPLLHLHYTSSVNGGPGSGKTSVVVSGIASMINTITGGKTIITAFNDVKARKLQKVKSDVNSFFQTKPDFIEYSDTKLLDILKSSDLTDVNAIVFDEAGLLNLNYLKEINAELVRINNERIKEGITPLHIFYTYDQYQNGDTGINEKKTTNTANNINAASVSVAGTPRLSFSFRSVNGPLKAVEDILRMSQHTKGPITTNLVTSYDENFNGVYFVKTKEELNKAVAELGAKIKSAKVPPSVAYISTNSKNSPSPAAAQYGFENTTSKDAQGDEWDYVIVDSHDGKVFENMVTKQEYYTALTRARKGAIVFISSEVSFESRKGTVREFTPMTPANVNKETMSKELSEITGDEQLPVTFDKSKLNEIKNVNGTTPGTSPQPTGDQPLDTTDEEQLDAYRKIVDGMTAKDSRVLLNTFYTVEGEMGIKKQILFDPKVRDASSYQMTIAKIGSPGYEVGSVVNKEESAKFKGKYAIFVEGVTPKGERALIGVVYNSDSEVDVDAYLRKEGIVNDDSGDIAHVFPLSSDVLRGASFFHPFIVDKSPNSSNKDLMDPAPERTLRELAEEASKNGIAVSPIMVVTQKPGIKNKKGVIMVNDGEPFVMMSYKHSQSEMIQLTSTGQIDPTSDEIKIMTIKRRFFKPQEVIDMLKPFYSRRANGKVKSPDLDTDEGRTFMAMYDGFWYNESGQNKEYLQTFRRVANELRKTNKTVDLFMLNYEQQLSISTDSKGFQKKAKSEYNFRWLFSNYIKGQIETNPSKLAEFNYGAIKPIFETMLKDGTFNNVLKYSPPIIDLSTSKEAAYVMARIPNKDFASKVMYATFHRIDPPKLKISPEQLLSAITGRATDTKQEVEQSGTIDNQLTSEDKVAGESSFVKPMNPAEFKRREFPASPKMAREALQKFRRDIVNNHLVLNVPNSPGAKPFIADIDVAMKALKSRYMSEANRKAISTNNNAKLELALGRNFNQLLSYYYPGISYNAKKDRYVFNNKLAKAASFTEQENQNLLADGISSIVKTYLYSTEITPGSGKYIGSKQISNLIPIFRGTNFADVGTLNHTAPRERGEVVAALKAVSSKYPEAKAIYDRFFSEEPVIVGKNVMFSTAMIETETGQALTDAIMQFFMKAEKYIPGFKEVTMYSDFDPFNGKYYTGVESSPKLPVGVSSPTYEKERFLINFNNILKSSKVTVSNSDVTLNGEKFTISPVVTVDHAMKMIHRMGLTNFTSSMMNTWIKRNNNATNLVQDYFVKSIKEWNKGNSPDITPVAETIVDIYMDSKGLGNDLAYLDGRGRKQYAMRDSSPMFHLHSYRANAFNSPLLQTNLLVDGSKYGFSTLNQPFNHLGVKVKDDGKIKTKTLSQMSVTELLDVYMIDGFISQIEKGRPRVALPVTVYSDSGTEVTPVFQSNHWMDGPDAHMSDLFDSRMKYYIGLEAQMLEAYAKSNIRAKSIVDLNDKLQQIPANKVQEYLSSEHLISGLHYDESLISKGQLRIKPKLIFDHNYYMNPANKTGFIAKVKADIADVIELTKDQGTAFESLYDTIKNKYKAHTPEQYISSFYSSWLIVSSEFQKMMNGPEYQYKGQNQQAFIDMVKRSRSLTSPASFFVLRNKDWREQVNAFRAANPGQPLPVKLKYEGKKLSRIQKVFRITDPVIPVTKLSNGSVVNQKFMDGATLKTGLTTIKQNFSTAIEFGPTAGPVMKNITHSFDSMSGTKSFVKNAEFEMTPEILSNADDWVIDLFTQMTSQPFSSPIDMNGTPILSAFELMRFFGVNPDLSNIVTIDNEIRKSEGRGLFDKVMDILVENGEQDSVVDEAIFQSSEKTGQRGVNQFGSTYKPSSIDISMKGIQQDAMKNPSQGLETKVLTQLVNAIGMNWVNGELVTRFYGNLAKITRDYLEANFSDTTSNGIVSRLKTFTKIMKDNLLRTDGVNYRVDAAAVNRLSVNDRMLSGKYAETVASEIRNRGVAFPLQGGHYVVHPALMPVYEVELKSIEDKIVDLEDKINSETLDAILKVQDEAAFTGARPLTPEEQKQEDIIKQQINAKYDTELKTLRANLQTTPQIGASIGTKRLILLKSQIDPTKHKVISKRPLKWGEATRKSDGKTLTQLYAEANNNPAIIESIHKSLQNEEWTPSETEILLPAEMASEFFLGKAIQDDIPIGDIDVNYFYSQIASKKELEAPFKSSATVERAQLIYESFQHRLKGIIARIPTSGKHSATVTKVVGFFNGSMNSVMVPADLFVVQGADQDYDKGSYVTYKSIVQHEMIDPNGPYQAKPMRVYNPEDFPDFITINKKPTGLIPFPENADRIKKMLNMQVLPPAIERMMLENDVVRSMNQILVDPRGIVESNIPVDDSIDGLTNIRNQILNQSDEKNLLEFDSLMAMLTIHQMNQAGGKNIIGIFANGAKAYNVLYTLGKMSGKPVVAGLKGYNKIWETYAAFISASVDNANIDVLGPVGVDEVVAPYVSYMISTGMDENQIKAFIDSPDAVRFFNDLRESSKFNSTKKFNIDNHPSMRSLYYKNMEWTILSKSLINRDIPVTMDEISNYITTLERYINYSFNDAKMDMDFDLDAFLNGSESYRTGLIQKYQSLINNSNEHQYNILQVFRDIPHMREYQKAVLAAHNEFKVIKAYDLIFRIHKSDINPEGTKKFYFVRDNSFEDDYNMIHGLFIHSYLNSRKTAGITPEPLGSYDQRKAFIDYMHKQLPTLKATYPDNEFVKDLQLEKDQFTGQSRIRLSDYYDMNDELRSLYMQEIEMLPEIDRKQLFLYNLIVTRDNNTKGSMTSLFSVSDKADYVNFIDYELSVNFDNVMQIRNEDVKRSPNSGLHQAIPYDNFKFDRKESEVKSSYTYKKIPVVEVNYIPGSSVMAEPVRMGIKDNVPNIILNPRQIILDFQSKVWMKPKKLPDGNYRQALPQNVFDTIKDYGKYILEVAYLHHTQGDKMTDSDIIKAALKTVNKKNVKNTSNKQMEKDQGKCDIPPSK